MSLLARFRKPGGLEKLVALLESSDSKARENMMKNIREEDAEFAKTVEAQLFTWNDLFAVDDLTLSDILSNVQPKMLALALAYLEEDKKQHLLKRLAHMQQAKVREEIDALGATPDKPQVATARRKVIETARQLEKAGKFTLKKV